MGSSLRVFGVIFSVARLLWDNPLVRPAIWALAGAVTLGVALAAFVRNDRQAQQLKRKMKDLENANDIRRRVSDVRAGRVRPDDITYRD